MAISDRENLHEIMAEKRGCREDFEEQGSTHEMVLQIRQAKNKVDNLQVFPHIV